MQAWDRRRAQHIAQAQQQQLAKLRESEECWSFAPSINERSRRIADAKRAREQGSPTRDACPARYMQRSPQRQQQQQQQPCLPELHASLLPLGDDQGEGFSSAASLADRFRGKEQGREAGAAATQRDQAAEQYRFPPEQAGYAAAVGGAGSAAAAAAGQSTGKERSLQPLERRLVEQLRGVSEALDGGWLTADEARMYVQQYIQVGGCGGADACCKCK